MKRFLIVSALLLLVSIQAAPKPVAVVTSQTAVKLDELVCRIVLAPQWLADTEAEIQKYKWTEWKNADYAKYSAVFFLVGDGTATGLKLLNFSPEDGAAAEAFVKDGGTIFFLSDRSPKPGSMMSTGPLANVLGMKKWGLVKNPVPSPATVPAAQILNSDPDIFKYTFATPLHGLSGVTTAEVLVGTPDGALVTVNRFGKGKAVFASARFAASGTPHYPARKNASPSLNQFFPVAKMLYAQLDPAQTAFKKVKREIWDIQPLGPKVSGYGPYEKRQPAAVSSAKKLTLASDGCCTLIRDGKPQAVFVVPDGMPGNPARYAAAELNALLKKMTGCTLPVRPEKSLKGQPPSEKCHYIAIGNTSFSRDLKFPDRGLAVEVSPNLIAVNGHNLTIAMMRFMQEFMGYRMLWPGPDGEVFTLSATVEVPAGKLTDAPFFAQRSVRNYLYRNSRMVKMPDGTPFKHHFGDRVLNGCQKLDFDLRKLPGMWKGYRSWWTANCLGGGLAIGGGGLFYGWDKRQAKGHPEYLALQIDGTRVPKVSQLRLCKSNPEVVKAAAATVLETLKKRPSLKYFVFELCDGGYDYWCMCSECRKLDPDVPDALRYTRIIHRFTKNRPTFRYPSFSDRHLKFAVRVAELVGKEKPDVKIGYMAYSQYVDRPFLFTGKLPENMFVIFVGFQYFNDKQIARARANYDFWASAANEIFLRPNFLHGGHNMPNVYVTEMARDLRHAAENGMIGGDFDSVRHNWATEGFNYYALARLLWDPTLTRDQLLDEYCDRPFGAAAPQVKEYLKSVEENTARIASGKGVDLTSIEDRLLDDERYMARLHHHYPAQLLVKWRSLLEKGAAAVPADSPERRRVEFLLAGLKFVEIETEMRRKEANAKPGERKKLLADTNAYIAELIALFEKYPFAVNIPIVAHNEWYQLWYKNGWRPPKKK